MNTMTRVSSPKFHEKHGLRSAAIAALVLLLGACASAPKPLRGEFAAISPQQAGQSGQTGERVRWGGSILAVETAGEQSCFVMLGKPLFDSSRPKEVDVSVGRFIACRDGFYDPAIFAKGRQLTVVGHVAGFENRAVGDYAYRYPRLDTEVIYLWPERDDDPLYLVGGIGWYPGPWGLHGYRVYHYYPRRGGGKAPSKPAPVGKH